jgi:eukaryotic-like serine/threonine-protein kinase
VLLGAIGFLGAQLVGGLAPASGSPSPSAVTFALPNWVGKPITAVQQDANNLGLTVDPQRENSSTVPNDQVISTEPTAGTQVKRGDTVTVHVSSGQEKVKVPSLLGHTREEARSTLQAAGLTLGSVTQESSAAEAGTVIRTDPAAGVDWPKGGQVNIVLSLGPTPSPTPVPTPPPTPTPAPNPSPTA